MKNKYKFMNLEKVILMTVLTLMLFLANSSTVKAAKINADDLIGQVNENGNPQWTNRRVNNGQVLSSVGGGAIDEVHHRLFVSANGSEIYVYNLATDNSLVDKKPDFVLGSDSLAEVISQGGVAQNRFSYAADIAYDSVHDRLFVADKQNSRVLVFDTSNLTNGMNAEHVLGQVDFSNSDPSNARNGMNSPNAVEYDEVNDRLFVADFYNARFSIFELSGGITDGMDASYITTFNYATDLVYDDSSKLLFVVENNVILTYDTTNLSDDMPFVNVLGGSGGCSPEAIYAPSGLAIDKTNKRLFASDVNNNRVSVFDYSGGITDNMPASAVLGQADLNTCSIDNQRSNYISPSRLIFNQSKQQLIVGTAEQGLKFFDVATISSNEDPVLTLSGLDAYGIRQDTSQQGNSTYLDSINHRLFVADAYNNRVLVFSLDDNNKFRHRYADNVLGQPDMFTGSQRTTINGLYNPKGITYDSRNDLLFVLEANNDRVLVFDLSSGITNGMDAAYVIGQADFTSSVNGTTINQFAQLDGAIYYDEKSERLFVGDVGNRRIMVYDLSAGITNGMDAVNVLGQLDFNTVDSAPSSQNILGFNITGFSYDPDRDLLFVSDGSERIIIYDLSSGITNGMPAAYVLGQPDFDSSNSGVSQNQFRTPRSNAYNPLTKQLFVGDRNNHRIMVFDLTEITNNENAVAVLGQDDFVSRSAVTARNTLRAPASLVLDVENNRLFVNDRESARITVTQLPNISSTLSNPVLKQSYEQTLQVNGGVGPYDYTLVGDLPDGLSLSSGGVISGTPTLAGVYNFKIKTTDSIGLVGLNEFTLTVSAGGGSDGNSSNTRIVPDVNEQSIESEISQGYISAQGGDASNTNQLTFGADFQFGISKATVLIPKGTVMTKADGSSFNGNELEQTLNLKERVYDNLGSVRFGISNQKMSFSTPITLNISVGSKYNGRKLSVYYKEEGDNNWHKQTNCKAQNGVCSFQTNHATEYAVVKSKLIDKDSKKYQKYHDYKVKFATDLNKERSFGIKNLRQSAMGDYLRLKKLYSDFVTKKLKLKSLDVKSQEEIRMYRGHLNYQKFQDLEDSIKD